MDDETFDLTVPADLPITGGLAESTEVQAALQTLFEGRLDWSRIVKDAPFPHTRWCSPTRTAGSGPRSSHPPSTASLAARTRSQMRIPRHRARCCASGPRPAVSAASRTTFGVSGARVTMAELARSEFHRAAVPHAPDREIVDRTGLSGFYDFELRFGCCHWQQSATRITDRQGACAVRHSLPVHCAARAA